MSDQPISYRVKPLPQVDYPQNLYKRLQTKAMRTPGAGLLSDHRLSQDTALIINRLSKLPEPLQPRPESSRPRQSPASRQQLVEARAIAQRVQDTSGSSRLEFLLRRQQSRRYDSFESNRQSMKALEHLAIARRSDQHYQIVIQGTKQPFLRQVFKTVEYCAEAATELEQKFALGGMLEFLNAEVQEAVEAIVWAVVVRERVERELAA
jgi:hypothetical protein